MARKQAIMIAGHCPEWIKEKAMWWSRLYSFWEEGITMASELFIGMHGSEDPTKATLPFLMAGGALDAGQKVAIVLVGDAVVLMKSTVAENVHGVGFTPLKDLMAKVFAAKVPIHIWGLCARARGLTDQDLAGKNAQFAMPADGAKLMAQYDKVVSF
jgi:predicted peroxiredoxin